MISRQLTGGAVAPLFFALACAGPALAFDPTDLICERGGFKTSEAGQFKEVNVEPERVWYLFRINRKIINAGNVSRPAELSALARTRAGNTFAVAFARYTAPPTGASHLAIEGLQTKLFSCNGDELIGVWVDRARLAWSTGSAGADSSGVMEEARRVLDSGSINLKNLD